MSGVTKKLISASGGVAGGFTAIEDVFSCFLYTGNGSTGSGITQTITNGINFTGEGGLLWIKRRDATGSHFLFDTLRGNGVKLSTDSTFGNGTGFKTNLLSDGFQVEDLSFVNGNGNTFASWSFRKAVRFFDVVTYSGNGASQTIPHNLGVEPGCIIVKNTGAEANWAVYHRGTGAFAFNQRMQLNRTDAVATSATAWNGTAPTDTEFSVGNFFNTNASGNTYVAYLFAHDPLGPSGDGSDGLIDCGSYTGNGSTDGPEIDLGWEPQWLLIKVATGTTDQWVIFDTMRGLVTGGDDNRLFPNLSNSELIGNDYVEVNSRGFKPTLGADLVNRNTSDYIYIAIRRGPMRAPESGTEVFAAALRDGIEPGFNSGFPVDMFLFRNKNNVADNLLGSRLTGNQYLITNSTAAEGTISSFETDYQDGWSSSSGVSTTVFSWMFRRAPEFFDVVAYTGDGTAGRTVPHNLGVAPEMMIVKGRNYITDWAAYHSAVGNTKYLIPNTTAAAATGSLWWNNTSPTADIFTLGNSSRVNNTSSNTYIAYLFATLAGVSKVGSYTGNGSSQTINCGFTTGARFIIIKRTDATGDWYVWDTARGIIAGNDPFLELNSTAAEVTTDDSIDPASSGFIVNQTAVTDVNVNAASYIFYAVA